MYNYLKALHVIFIVTWFSGLFYIVRLFIYHREAQDQPEPERTILSRQYVIMIRRLWLGITWPSAILTLILGVSVWSMLGGFPAWLMIKLVFVLGLFFYHYSLHVIYRQQLRSDFRYGSGKLRIWNEVATVFLVGIVMLAVVKSSLSVVWGLAGLALLILLLLAAIKGYARLRERKK